VLQYRQTIYVRRNTEAESRNNCCSGKTVSSTYSRCMFVALLFQNAKRMLPNILSRVASPDLSLFSTLYHKQRDFPKKIIIKHTMRALTFSTIYVWNIPHSKNNSKRFDQKCLVVVTQSTRYSCRILMKLEFSRQIFIKPSSNIKFNENLSCDIRFFSTQTDRREDMTTLILIFFNYANAPKSWPSRHKVAVCRLDLLDSRSDPGSGSS
jgi:hypothetical protein